MLKNKNIRRPSARDYVLFYNFACGLLIEMIAKPNFFSFIIKPSFGDVELLSVSIDEKEEVCWEYGLWDNEKDSKIYFSEDFAVDKYRYQILRPNPSLFFTKGTLPKEAYNYTLRLLSNNEYPPYDEKVPLYAIDGTTYILDFPDINQYGWHEDLPDVYTKFSNTLKEIEINMQIGRQLAIQKIV